MYSVKNIKVWTFVFFLVLPFFLNFVFKKVTVSAKKLGPFQETETLVEAEKTLVEEMDKIFEKSLSKLKEITPEKMEEEKSCVFFDDHGKIIEHLAKENSRPECVGESALELIENFREKMLFAREELESKEGITFYDMFSSHSQKKAEIEKILKNLRLSLDMALENYDLLRFQKTISLQQERQVEALRELSKEVKKIKEETYQIKEKILSPSSNQCI